MIEPDRVDEDAERESEECPDCQYTEGHAFDCPSDRTDYDYELAQDLWMETP